MLIGRDVRASSAAAIGLEVNEKFAKQSLNASGVHSDIGHRSMARNDVGSSRGKLRVLMRLKQVSLLRTSSSSCQVVMHKGLGTSGAQNKQPKV
jgi:hypothetical protein